MKKEYDFKGARKGPVVAVPKGKTRVTIRIDDTILKWFRARVHEAGGGNYQSMINQVLREFIAQKENDLEDTLRRVIREELHGGRPRRRGSLTTRRTLDPARS